MRSPVRCENDDMNAEGRNSGDTILNQNFHFGFVATENYTGDLLCRNSIFILSTASESGE